MYFSDFFNHKLENARGHAHSAICECAKNFTIFSVKNPIFNIFVNYPHVRTCAWCQCADVRSYFFARTNARKCNIFDVCASAFTALGLVE